ncbi:MAG: glycoside hydrolase family 3 N-terminal domain-containing protein [Cyanobacteriota bacterium]
MQQKIINNIVNELSASLSIEQKLSQLFIVGYYGLNLPEELFEWARNYLGGIVFFRDNIDSPLNIAETIWKVQLLSSIGLFTAIDQEGGLVERITGLTQVPSFMALSSSGDHELVIQSNDIIARELSLLGFNLNFTPVVDVNTKPENPIIGIRSFGDDPIKVGELGLKVIDVMRKHNIIPVAKHFPGHGATDSDSHLDLPAINISYDKLCRDHFFPFQEAIANSVEMIMVCHVSFKQITERDKLPASLAYDVVTDLLVNKMNYNGLIITDDLEMKAISKLYSIEKAAESALNAGVDILLYRNYNHAKVAYRHILSKISSGNLSESRLNLSFKKIIELKIKYSILKTLFIPDLSKVNSLIKSDSAVNLAQTLFDRSITVYKDCEIDNISNKLIISVDKNQLIHHYKSEENLNLSDLIPDTEEIKISLNPDKKEIERVLSKVNKYEKVIIVSYNAFFNKNQADLIKKIIKKKEVYLLAAGSPYDVSIFASAAFIALSYGYANAALRSFVKVLKREIEPNKTLPVNIAL